MNSTSWTGWPGFFVLALISGFTPFVARGEMDSGEGACTRDEECEVEGYITRCENTHCYARPIRASIPPRTFSLADSDPPPDPPAPPPEPACSADRPCPPGQICTDEGACVAGTTVDFGDEICDADIICRTRHGEGYACVRDRCVRQPTCGSLRRGLDRATTRFNEACSRERIEAAVPADAPDRAQVIAHVVSAMSYERGETPPASADGAWQGPLASLEFLQRRMRDQHLRRPPAAEGLKIKLFSLRTHLASLLATVPATALVDGTPVPDVLQGNESAARDARAQSRAAIERIEGVEGQLTRAHERHNDFLEARDRAIFTNASYNQVYRDGHETEDGLMERAFRGDATRAGLAARDEGATRTRLIGRLKNDHRDELITYGQHERIGGRSLPLLDSGLCEEAQRGEEGCHRTRRVDGNLDALVRIFSGSDACPSDLSSSTLTLRRICEAKAELAAFRAGSYDALRLAATCRNLLDRRDRAGQTLAAAGRRCRTASGDPVPCDLSSLLPSVPSDAQADVCLILSAVGIECPTGDGSSGD